MQDNVRVLCSHLHWILDPKAEFLTWGLFFLYAHPHLITYQNSLEEQKICISDEGNLVFNSHLFAICDYYTDC